MHRLHGVRAEGGRTKLELLYREDHLSCHGSGQWHSFIWIPGSLLPSRSLSRKQASPYTRLGCGCAPSVKVAFSSLTRSRLICSCGGPTILCAVCISSPFPRACHTHTFLHSGTFVSRVLDLSVQRCEYTRVTSNLDASIPTLTRVRRLRTDSELAVTTESVEISRITTAVPLAS